MKLFNLLFFTLLYFASCEKFSQKEDLVHKKESLKDFPEKNKSDSVKIDFISILELKDFPIIEKTNFNTFEKSGRIYNLLLDEIKLDLDPKNITEIRLNYLIHFSPSFHSIVFSFKKGDHEIFTYLVNLDKDGNQIDKLLIAYDEIAESAFITESLINSDKIEVTEVNYMQEPPLKNTETYHVQNDGRFFKMK